MFESSPWEIIYLLLVMAGVVALAFYVSKWLGKRYTGKSSTTLGKLAIIDRLVLGQDKTLLVVKAGEKTMLLSATQHHIEMLCELNSEEFAVKEATSPTGAAFSDVFRSTLKDNWGIQFKGKSEIPKEKADGEVGQHFDDDKKA